MPVVNKTRNISSRNDLEKESYLKNTLYNLPKLKLFPIIENNSIKELHRQEDERLFQMLQDIPTEDGDLTIKDGEIQTIDSTEYIKTQIYAALGVSEEMLCQ